MKWLRIGLIALGLAMASYAHGAGPEAYLGKPAAKRHAPRKPAAAAVKGSLPAATAADRAGSLKRYGAALGAVKPEARAATRGAAETQVYQQASPSVVLIVTPRSLGSGVVVGADGKIVTNLHVVGDYETVGVIFKPPQEGATIDYKAEMKRAKVLRHDELTDLALIQVEDMPATVKPLALGAAESVQVGADVHAIGHPTGEAWSYTRGIVSQVRRDYAWTAAGDRYEHRAMVIQTQTPINPGNSGGPLLNEKLEVVGINSFTTSGEGLNFAVSANDVKAMLALTADRTAVKRSNKPGGVCEAAEVDHRPSEDPKGVEFLIDDDCDDQGDYTVLVPDKRSEPMLTFLDTDDDGKNDTVLVDKNRDGSPEAGLYDTDGNGKLDMEGTFRKGEDEPYKWVKIKE